MAEDKKLLSPLIEDALKSVTITENIIVEAIQDMIKEEIKKHVRQKLEENPELKKEIKEAIKIYFEGKEKEIYATVKLAKAWAKLSLQLLPANMKEELTKEVLELFEKEIKEMVEKAL